MPQKIFLSLCIWFYLFACSDRVSAPIEYSEQVPLEITNGEFLKIITPDQFGQPVDSDQGVFRDALFVDYQAIDVWAVYFKTGGNITRLSAELYFGQPLLYFMHDDKYTDPQGVGHAAVYAGVPETADQTVDGIYLAIPVSNDTTLQNKYFQTIQPSEFGEVIETVQGDFIQAFFANIQPEQVWSIEQTLPQGTVAKVRLARRIDKPIVYYLTTETRLDSSGNPVNGCVVGLPYDEIAPQQNIEILIRRTL